jgi:hypothetical protein
MNQETLKKLEGISDIDDLRRAIEALCVPFSGIKDIRLLRNKTYREFLCFVDLDAPDSPDLKAPIVEIFGGIDFETSVAFRIPLSQ